jgi:hypothetical protein
MSNSTYALTLITAAKVFSTYFKHIIFALSLTGSGMNILVFTNLKIFRLNRCTFYLIAESIVEKFQQSQTFVNE